MDEVQAEEAWGGEAGAGEGGAELGGRGVEDGFLVAPGVFLEPLGGGEYGGSTEGREGRLPEVDEGFDLGFGFPPAGGG